MTSVSRGAPICFQSGNNSFKALGSKTLPLRICAPMWDPFSIRHTSKSSRLFYLHNCFILMAADSPDGPPPTISISYSSLSLSILSSSIEKYLFYIL